MKAEPHFSPPTFEKVPKDGKVRVERPNADGEIVIEGEVPQSRFKRPKRQPLTTPGFRERVLAGDRPGLLYPGDEDCPVEAGQEICLTANVSITIVRVTKTKGGDHRARYSVLDMRATIPRRTPKMFEPPETDRYGLPIPPSDAAIAAATIDGNYCQGGVQAVPDIGEEVDIDYRRVMSVKKRAKDAETEQPESVRRKRERAIRDELRETLRGLDPESQALLLARIEREIEEARDASAAIV